MTLMPTIHRSTRRAGSGPPPRRLAAAVAVAAMVVLSVACQPSTVGQNGPTATSETTNTNITNGGTAGNATTSDSPTESTSTETTSTETTSTETTPAGSTTSEVDTRPVIGNVELSPRNVECSYIPNGNLDGSDGLTVFAYVLLIGASPLPNPLSNTMAMSNGFSTSYTGHPNNQAFASFQGPIRATDWGRSLTVRITADANDQYRETSESDNSIEVTVTLPPTRSAKTIDPLPCTARRA
jgi:hypothetical protein